MNKQTDSNIFPALVSTIVEGMEDVKAQNITVLNLAELENSVCDYFIVCEGTSNTQVKAISARVEEKVRKTLDEKPWHVEGQDNSEWVLMDYVNIVAHVFQSETRKFYDLESLWGDAEITVLEQKY